MLPTFCQVLSDLLYFLIVNKQKKNPEMLEKYDDFIFFVASHMHIGDNLKVFNHLKNLSAFSITQTVINVDTLSLSVNSFLCNK